MQQTVLANAWKPYMKNLDTLFTDATCYESQMRFSTDAKLLEKMLAEILRECRVHADKVLLTDEQAKAVDVITKKTKPHKTSTLEECFMGELCLLV